MKRFRKILFFFFTAAYLSSCNLYKVVPEGKYLLRDNKLEYRHKDIIKPKDARIYILQQPNFYVLGYPVLVGVYSIADPQPDSTFFRFQRKHPGFYKTFVEVFSEKQVYQLKKYYVTLNKTIQTLGEEPVLIDSALTEKSRKQLHYVFKNKGFLDNEVFYNIKPLSVIKANVFYSIIEKERYKIDSVYYHIYSQYINRLFPYFKNSLETKPGRFYERRFLVHDREYTTSYLRNHGFYDFQASYIKFDVVKDPDSITVDVHKNVLKKVEQIADSIYEKEFVPHRYEKVFVSVNPSPKDSVRNPQRFYFDSIAFFYSPHKYYRPKLLREAIYFSPGDLYSDDAVFKTRRQLMGLQNFRQVFIRHNEKNDSILDAEIVLVPLKKFAVNLQSGVTHSSIRPLGVSGEASFEWRNIFHGFENLSLSTIYLLASSTRFTGDNSRFFNVRELGVNLSLTIPRIIAPYGRRWVPLFMQPKTILSLRYYNQENIGLDREKFYTIYKYRWQPNRIVTNELSPLKTNYVNNKNPDRYFYIYTTAFHELKNIASTYFNMDISPANADDFIDYVFDNLPSYSPVYKTVKRIYERKIRLTENVLVISSFYDLNYDTRSNLFDKDFFLVKFYFEVAGWIPGLVSKFKDMPDNSIGQKMINKVPYSQFIKTELSYVKYWQWRKKNVVAMRLMGGLAIPYGNSTNIPFVEAYYAGGSNDVRAWRAFELGPGSTGGLSEFNEGNLKLLFNLEARIPVYESHHLGLFVDAGNIWNVFDDIPYEKAKFKGFSSLKDIAIGSGIGYRYDVGIFALRVDLAFKNYDPALPEGKRWIFDYTIKNATLNLGINYPF